MKAEDILMSVAEKITGDRAKTHGPMTVQFKHCAALWSAYLGIPINEIDVAELNILQKASRVRCGAINLDDFEDQAGYAACAGQISSVDAVKP